MIEARRKVSASRGEDVAPMEGVAGGRAPELRRGYLANVTFAFVVSARATQNGSEDAVIGTDEVAALATDDERAARCADPRVDDGDDNRPFWQHREGDLQHPGGFVNGVRLNAVREVDHRRQRGDPGDDRFHVPGVVVAFAEVGEQEYRWR